MVSANGINGFADARNVGIGHGREEWQRQECTAEAFRMRELPLMEAE